MNAHQSWNNLSDHFDLHDPKFENLDPASAANRMIAWPAILNLSANVRGSKAVDFGCGTGGLSQLLFDAGFQVTGIDQSPEMLAIGRKKTKGEIDYRFGSVGQLASLNEIDLITCSLVLNYLPILDTFLDVAEGVLSKGGLLVTADLNRAYVAGCLSNRVIYEDFDSLTNPRIGILNFGKGVRVPLTIRSEQEYDHLLVSRGWKKAGSAYPHWPAEYLKVFSMRLSPGVPTDTPKYQVLAYQRGQ